MLTFADVGGGEVVQNADVINEQPLNKFYFVTALSNNKKGCGI